jgi:hypothetical protein
MNRVGLNFVRLVERVVHRVDTTLQSVIADWVARTDDTANQREKAALERIARGDVASGLTPTELAERWKIERKTYAP